MMSPLTQSSTTSELPNLADEHLSESLRVLPEGIQVDRLPALVAIKTSKTNRRQRSASADTISNAAATALRITQSSSGSHYDRKRRYTTITESKKELQDWIEMLLGIQFELPFFEQLKHGTVLCDLLNTIKQGTCSKYKQSDRLYIQKRNVSIYLSGCRSLGIHKNNCFIANDLVSDYQLRSNQRKIISNLRHVWRVANKMQLKQRPSESNDVCDVFDNEDDDTQIIVIDTPTKKSINKFKLKDYSLSINSESAIEISMSSALKSSYSPRDAIFQFSDACYLDAQSDRSKELLIAGYFRQHEHIEASIVKTICLFILGDVASLYWTLSTYKIDDFLDEEEDILQYEKQLVLGNGSIVMDVAISHSDDVVSISIDNVNNVQIIAYCYCECMNNNRAIKHVYNSMHGANNVDIDVMDIIAWREQNALGFKNKFLELNSNTKKAARYYRIPHFEETLKLKFYMQIISAHNNINMNRKSEYKWHSIQKVSEEDIFEDFEMYSDNFGDDSIEYDKCWTLVAKYSDFYEQFYFALKLLKLPMKIRKLTIKCCLSLDGVSYPKTQEIDLNKNTCEFDDVWTETDRIHEKTLSILIEITEVTDIESRCIHATEWKSYGIK